MNPSLFLAVQATNADHLSFKDHTDPVSSSSTEAHTQVGGGRHSHSHSFWHDLTADEREVAIELAEIKQAEYERSGQHQRAIWMGSLRAHLVAGRNQGAKA